MNWLDLEALKQFAQLNVSIELDTMKIRPSALLSLIEDLEEYKARCEELSHDLIRLQEEDIG
jgi:hypothetical protein